MPPATFSPPSAADRADASPGRHRASSARRSAILTAALECFTGRGYDRTTMADVCEAASASTGSVYHHFQSKEQLARALFLEGVRNAQDECLRALVRHRTAEHGIRALVSAYLDWVEAHPDWARFLLTMRHAPFMDPGEEELSGMNREVAEAARAWLERHIERGALPALDMVLFYAIVFGPTRHFALRWLDRKTAVTLDQAKRSLGTAVWRGLAALCRASD